MKGTIEEICTKEKSNIVELVGILDSNVILNHENHGEEFYSSVLQIKRTSGTNDFVPIIISGILLNENMLNNKVHIYGQFRSYNKKENGEKSKLVLNVFVTDISLCDDEIEDMNEIYIDGTLCKEPSYRYTPKGREITDTLIAVNRSYGKSDYIPCIFWGRMAKLISNYHTGDKVSFIGMIQSREYCKQLDDGSIDVRIAYEVSVKSIININ